MQVRSRRRLTPRKDRCGPKQLSYFSVKPKISCTEHRPGDRSDLYVVLVGSRLGHHDFLLKGSCGPTELIMLQYRSYARPLTSSCVAPIEAYGDFHELLKPGRPLVWAA